jgi:hypothetical protein
MWAPPGSARCYLIDEAQEMNPDVLSELPILASTNFDATSLLIVILSRDS